MQFLLFILTFAAAAAAVPVYLAIRTTCYSGVYVIGARGSEEAAGYGSVASVVSGVLAAIPNSRGIALDYPASVLDPLYDDFVTGGINTLISLVESYASSCSGNIVLVSFSQGANVITDALAGGVLKPTPLSASYASHISAITVYGDLTFTHGQSFDAGTDTGTDGEVPTWGTDAVDFIISKST
ncbi:hypothetical protein Sste5346_008027 [Sporothrix stenoceras]|uniref:Carbohydrate esterase family 5 protein n=1 Tax=Sporothrix stenoceras TaxID=5173 RepID=A0ABR3YRA5_9PEZI